MKRIPIESLASRVADLTTTVGKETVLLTRDGKPFALVSDASGYDWEDIGYMTDPEFWKMIRERRAEPATVTLEEVEAMVARQEAAESNKGSHRPKSSKKKAS